MYRFGEHEIDVPAREVRCGGETVHLEPQAFDLLVHLIEHRDRVVTKAELLDAVWGHRFVSEAALTTRVKEIRRALGDDGRLQAVVKNVPGRGYRFVADVDAAAAPATASDRGVDLVGRDELTRRVVDLIGTGPIVTLVGPGGVGKSTLARAALHALHDASGQQIAMIELATLRDGAEVVPAMALALDTLLEPDHADRALFAMAAQPIVLLLDNCEHVADAVAQLLERMMAAPSVRARVLATSQVRLGLGAETLVVVEPLEVADAVELFSRRALAVRPTFDAAAMEGRVAVLVDQLDRLPLTLEMAAARLGSMTFEDLETAVSSPQQLVQVTHRSPTRRHRTLRAVVEWSTALLDDEQRVALTECSVFAGTFGARDATAVLSAADVAPSLVAGLAERSLMAVDLTGSSARYRMLETVRTVATDWLDRDPISTRSRYLGWVLAEAAEVDDRLRTTGEGSARTRLDEVAADIRRAHPWAATHDPESAARLSASLHLAAYSTFWREPAVWSRSLVMLHPDLSVDQLAGAHLVLAAEAANRGDLDEARARTTPLLGSNDAMVVGTALEIMSDVELYAGDLDATRRTTDRLRTIGIDLGDRHLQAWADVNHALAWTFDGEPREALALLDQRVDVDLAPSDLGWLAFTRAEALSATSDPDAADSYLRAIALSRSVGNPFIVSVGQQALASLYGRAGRVGDALATYRECLTNSLRHGNMVHSVTTVRNLVELLADAGAARGAAELSGAMTRPEVRASYGAEAERQQRVIERLVDHLGHDVFDECASAGRVLDVDGAVRRAVELIDSLH